MTEQAVSQKKESKVCEIRMPADVRNDEVVKAFTELCHKYNLEAKIRGASQRGAPRTNPEGEIIIRFLDTKFDIVSKDDRKARKYLRKHGLSVTNAKKEGNVWSFPHQPKSITAKPKAAVPAPKAPATQAPAEKKS